MARKHHNRPDFSQSAQPPAGEPVGEPDGVDDEGTLDRMADAIAEDHVVPFQPVSPPDSVPSREGELVVAAAAEQADAEPSVLTAAKPQPFVVVRGDTLVQVVAGESGVDPSTGESDKYVSIRVTTHVLAPNVSDELTQDSADRLVQQYAPDLAAALRKSWQHLLSLDATAAAALESPTAAISPPPSPAASAAILEATLPGAPVPAGRYTA